MALSKLLCDLPVKSTVHFSIKDDGIAITVCVPHKSNILLGCTANQFVVKDLLQPLPPAQADGLLAVATYEAISAIETKLKEDQ